MTHILKPFSLLTIALLLLAVFCELDYGYYTFLRLVSTTCFSLSAIYVNKNNQPYFTIIFIVLGLLFNPFVPVELERENWRLFDLLSVGIISAFLFWQNIIKYLKAVSLKRLYVAFLSHLFLLSTYI